jgi:hypothetical protein
VDRLRDVAWHHVCVFSWQLAVDILRNVIIRVCLKSLHAVSEWSVLLCQLQCHTVSILPACCPESFEMSCTACPGVEGKPCQFPPSRVNVHQGECTMKLVPFLQLAILPSAPGCCPGSWGPTTVAWNQISTGSYW